MLSIYGALSGYDTAVSVSIVDAHPFVTVPPRVNSTLCLSLPLNTSIVMRSPTLP